MIVDFGKACNVTNGKSYKLSDIQKEQDHPHIASDLRDGACKQSILSDIFALGRVRKLVNSVPQLQSKDLEELHALPHALTCTNVYYHTVSS